MRLPRDLSGRELARATIPDHAALRVGTLAGIIDDVASHVGRGRDDLLAELFGS
jgi:hypothetical protein